MKKKRFCVRLHYPETWQEEGQWVARLPGSTELVHQGPDQKAAACRLATMVAIYINRVLPSDQRSGFLKRYEGTIELVDISEMEPSFTLSAVSEVEVTGR